MGDRAKDMQQRTTDRNLTRSKFEVRTKPLWYALYPLSHPQRTISYNDKNNASIKTQFIV